MVIDWSQIDRHWIIGGLGASLMWFLAGKQSLSNKSQDAALFWQGVGAFIALAVFGCIIKRGEWIALPFALAVLVMELRSIRQILALARVPQQAKRNRADERPVK